jgi:hypothetical protein
MQRPLEGGLRLVKTPKSLSKSPPIASKRISYSPLGQRLAIEHIDDCLDGVELVFLVAVELNLHAVNPR